MIDVVPPQSSTNRGSAGAGVVEGLLSIDLLVYHVALEALDGK